MSRSILYINGCKWFAELYVSKLHLQPEYNLDRPGSNPRTSLIFVSKEFFQKYILYISYDSLTQSLLFGI